MSSHPFVMRGTILATGTLSTEFDLGGMDVVGLKIDGSPTNGTLSFQVSSIGDDGTNVTYRDLYSAGAVLGFNIPSATSFALGSVEMAPLLAFRYLKVKTSVAQATGMGLIFIAKG